MHGGWWYHSAEGQDKRGAIQCRINSNWRWLCRCVRVSGVALQPIFSAKRRSLEMFPRTCFTSQCRAEHSMSFFAVSILRICPWDRSWLISTRPFVCLSGTSVSQAYFIQMLPGSRKIEAKLRKIKLQNNPIMILKLLSKCVVPLDLLLGPMIWFSTGLRHFQTLPGPWGIFVFQSLLNNLTIDLQARLYCHSCTA